MRFMILSGLVLAMTSVSSAQASNPKTSSDASLTPVQKEAQRIRAFRQATGMDYRVAPDGLKDMPLYIQPTPSAEPVAVTLPSSTAGSHVVQKGDTLYGISKRYNVDLNALRSANAIEGSSIQLGQSLIIPSSREVSVKIKRIVEPVEVEADTQSVSALEKPSVYAVAPKDTLYAIAGRTCTSPKVLIELNGLSQPDQLKPGQRLALPETHCLTR